MLKKNYTWGACLAAITLLTCGFADNREDYKYSARNVDTDECCPQKSCCGMDKIDRVITPDAGPCVANGADVFITADFIYWSVRQDGLGYAQTGTLSNLLPLDPDAKAGKGSVQHVNFDWEPGFKVGLGLNLGHDGWDIYAEYTWLRSDPSRSTTTRNLDNALNTLRPMWEIEDGYNLSTDIQFASGNWDFHLNVIDLELGRNFYVSKYLTTRPHIGLKGTWQDDDLSIRYRETTKDGSTQTETTSEARMKDDIDYWGIGIRTGMDNAWYFMRNFCIFGDWALTALWGRFDIEHKDYWTPDIEVPEETQLTRNTENDFHSIKGVLELSLGLRYDIWFSNDDYHFGLQAGWEEQIWFSHNTHYKQAEEVAHGDLVMHGLTLKARFDF